MNIQRIKLLTWVGSLALGGYLAWFVAEFLKNRGELELGVSNEAQREVLDSIETPEPPKDNVVDYKLVQAVFHNMDWTGKEAPKIREVKEEPKVVETPKKKVAELLKVLVVRVDTDDSAGSLAYVKYTDNVLLQRTLQRKDPEDNILRVGETLPEPHAYARVDRISSRGVHFVFEGDDREPEILAPVEFPSGRAQIVKVGTDGAIIPERQQLIQRSAGASTWRPAQTQLVGKNVWQVGTETVQTLEQDYSRILSQDVRYKKHRDPRTGQVTGIAVTYVAGGSLPEAHGLQSGDVIKSINGEKVTSVNGAIAYVKKAADTTDEWVVVIENKGREFTRLFRSPQD